MKKKTIKFSVIVTRAEDALYIPWYNCRETHVYQGYDRDKFGPVLKNKLALPIKAEYFWSSTQKSGALHEEDLLIPVSNCI